MEITPKRFGKGDIPTKVEWMNNPKINQTMFFDLPASIERTEKWFQHNVGNQTRVDFTFTQHNEIAAFGGFTGISAVHKNAEFYIMVHPEKHGMGIGKRTSFWMYNYAFSALNLHKIYLYTNDSNLAAYKLYEKAGFTLEGVLKEHKFKNGEFQNRRFYGLLKSEWLKLPWRKNIDNEL